MILIFILEQTVIRGTVGIQAKCPTSIFVLEK